MTTESIAAVTAHAPEEAGNVRESKASELAGTANNDERPVAFACQGERLLGILHPATGDTGIVVIVGGPQYRAGSHRMFVQTSRALAMAGYPVLRFDVRGMGDSTGAQRCFEAISDDIGAAITHLQAQQPQLRRVVLWGLCDGASAALLYLHDRDDLRVKGLCLLNPWVRSPASLALTHVKHYYRRRLMEREFWAKLLKGRVAGQALRALWNNLRIAWKGSAPTDEELPFQTRMAATWSRWRGPILLMLSGNDYTASEFLEYTRTDPAWHGALSRDELSICRLPEADHTLSTRSHQDEADARLTQWLQTLP